MVQPLFSHGGARMTAQTTESVLVALRRARLLQPEQLARAEAAARRGKINPDRLVARMRDAGWLTRFQADSVLAGQAAGLVFGPYALLDRLGDGGMGVV